MSKRYRYRPCTHSIGLPTVQTPADAEAAGVLVQDALAASTFRWGIKFSHCVVVGGGWRGDSRGIAVIEHSKEQPLCAESEKILAGANEALKALSTLGNLQGAK